MAIKTPDWKKWRDKLKNVYRFQIVDEKSYDVKMVLELNRLNVIVITGLLLFFFTVLNFLFIAFTPLKQYIPGYGSNGRKEVVRLSMKAEELEDKMEAQQKYIANLRNILNDKVVVDAVKTKLAKKSKVDTGILSVKATDESQFVKTFEQGLQNADLLKSIHDSKTNVLNNLQLEKPVNGAAVSKYSQSTPRIVFTATANEEVHAVLPGNVILTGSSMADGYYIAVQAENQLVYILKNNSKILKKTGTFVRSGEPVAIAGKGGVANSYACTLEIWYKGQTFDPSKFIK
jgi:septal ring factor EnvC (AmiA/AmiB activator)